MEKNYNGACHNSGCTQDRVVIVGSVGSAYLTA